MKLLIVESPGKIKKLNSILKNDGFIVKASVGHVSDLPRKELSIDIKNGFKPKYEISKDKSSVVNDLKKAVEKVGAENVILAADEDREGEAIAFHLANLLKLDLKHNNRITFNSITKDAILEALKKPRTVALDLVRAQEARRVIDRMVGYIISPILWNKLNVNQQGLSAGRVQSPALKLVVEQHQKQLDYFKTEQSSAYKYTAVFQTDSEDKISARLVTELDEQPENFEELFSKQFTSDFSISDVKEEETLSKPQAPFITSTLQQDASKRFKIKVADVMKIAQKLYEGGFITYLRTDSPTLSPEAQEKVKTAIIGQFGEDYYLENKFKSKGDAQEAHECIRPARFDFSEDDLKDLSEIEKKIFQLIKDCALASQMQPAKFNKSTIEISNGDYTYQSVTSSLVFEGYKRQYDEIPDDEEEKDDEVSIKPEIGQKLKAESFTAKENLPAFPKSYNEATLVEQLEKLGIGRPSTYAAILTNILGKQYIVIGDNAGNKYPLKQFVYTSSGLSSTSKDKAIGSAKNVLIPSETGIILSNFLEKHFTEIFDYKFTANIEKEFDEIVSNKTNYLSVVSGFYKNLEDSLDKVTTNVADVERPKNYKELGDFEGGKVVVGNGKHGFYAALDKGEKEREFASLDKSIAELNDITLEMAIEALKKKREGGSKPSNVIKEFSKDFKIINGKYGPCILKGKDFTPIFKDKQEKAAELTKEECLEIIKSYKEYKKKKK